MVSELCNFWQKKIPTSVRCEEVGAIPLAKVGRRHIACGVVVGQALQGFVEDVALSAYIVSAVSFARLYEEVFCDSFLLLRLESFNRIM